MQSNARAALNVGKSFPPKWNGKLYHPGDDNPQGRKAGRRMDDKPNVAVTAGAGAYAPFFLPLDGLQRCMQTAYAAAWSKDAWEWVWNKFESWLLEMHDFVRKVLGVESDLKCKTRTSLTYDSDPSGRNFVRKETVCSKLYLIKAEFVKALQAHNSKGLPHPYLNTWLYIMDVSENTTDIDSYQVSHVGVWWRKAWEGALMYCNHKREEEGWLSLSGYS